MKNASSKEHDIINLIKNHFPNIQAIDLFGSYGTDEQTSKNDVDIALLLPHDDAKVMDNLYGTELHSEIESLLHAKVDLINLRMVDLVFQKEIISAERRIYCSDAYASDEFEMLTISFYQKLNEERAEIVEDAIQTGRFYDV